MNTHTTQTLWKSIIIVLLLIGAIMPAYGIVAVAPASVTDTMREGEVRTYSLNGLEYEVALVFVSDPGTSGREEAKFSVNGELSATLGEGDSSTVSGDANILVREILSGSREGIVTFVLTYTGSTGMQSCRDTDNGINYNTKGYLVAPGLDSSLATDFCDNTFAGKNLREYYCDSNGNGQSQNYYCPNGCSDGVCLPAINNTWCRDRDNGQDPNTASYAEGSDYSGQTGIIWGQYSKNRCDATSGNSRTAAYDCCSDSANNNQLNEAYCDASGRLQTVGLNCPYGCENGACKPAPPTAAWCRDSDNGKDAYNAGVAEGADYAGTSGVIWGQYSKNRCAATFDNSSTAHYDCCLDNSISDQLNEAYCENGQVMSEGIVCPYGCENGACKRAPSGTTAVVVMSPNSQGFIGTMNYAGKAYGVTFMRETLYLENDGATISAVLRQDSSGLMKGTMNIAGTSIPVTFDYTGRTATFAFPNGFSMPGSTTPPTTDGKNFIIVVGERSPTADVVLAVDIAKFAQDRYGRDWYDLNGVAMLDKDAYAKYSQDWMADKLFVVINGKSATIVVGKNTNTGQVVKANDVQQYLQGRGITVTTKISHEVSRSIFVINPSQQYCESDGIRYNAGDSFKRDCNTCSCGENGVVVCTMRACPVNQYTLSEGESRTVTVGGEDVEVSLVWMSTSEVGKIPTLKFSIDGSVTRPLTAGESETLNGVKLTVLFSNAGATNGAPGSSTFTLESVPSADEYALREGQARTYTVNGNQLEVTLVFVSDPTDANRPRAKFSINGELTSEIYEGGQQLLANGAKIYVREIEASAREGSASFKLEYNAPPAAEYTLREGETGKYYIGGKNREVTLVFVSDSYTGAQEKMALPTVKFSIDGQISPALASGKSFMTSDGVQLTVLFIGVTGRDGSATFNLMYAPAGPEGCVYNGNRYAVGQTFKPDCNTCTCNRGGQVVCTKIACPVVSCDDNSDCASGEYCENGNCRANGAGGCSNGCSVDNRCLPYGTRIANGEALFCDISGAMSEQKSDGSSCQNSYECASNQCLNAECQSLDKQLRETQGTLDRVVAWLRSMFGFGK